MVFVVTFYCIITLLILWTFRWPSTFVIIIIVLIDILILWNYSCFQFSLKYFMSSFVVALASTVIIIFIIIVIHNCIIIIFQTIKSTMIIIRIIIIIAIRVRRLTHYMALWNILIIFIRIADIIVRVIVWICKMTNWYFICCIVTQSVS